MLEPCGRQREAGLRVAGKAAVVLGQWAVCLHYLPAIPFIPFFLVVNTFATDFRKAVCRLASEVDARRHTVVPKPT